MEHSNRYACIFACQKLVYPWQSVLFWSFIYMCVCVCVCVHLSTWRSLSTVSAPVSKKQGQIGVKLPFLRSMIPYIVHIFWLSACGIRLTILLFNKLNKKGLLSEFHAHMFNGYVIYCCDLFATFLLVEMVWAVIQSRYLRQAWDKIYSRDHMQFLVWSNF